MSPASVEERVRDYVEAQRAQIQVPPVTASRILHAVQVSRPTLRPPRLAFLRVAAAIAAVLLVGGGIAWMRTAQMSAGIPTGSWSAASSMAVPRANHTATLLPNGKVLVVGGRGLLAPSAPWQPADSAIASAELYDPATRRWSSAGSLTTPRLGHTATLLANGEVLVVGGTPKLPNTSDPAGADFLSSAELYDPQTNSWAAAASMLQPRSNHTATLLADGRVLVTGGIAAAKLTTGGALASAELYDPVSNRWTSAAPMQSARWNHSATLLSDHSVLVAGGMDRLWDVPLGAAPTTGLSSAELFDPVTNSWSPAPAMRYGRISPTATLLSDGRVLVVGDSGVNERTAELFDPAVSKWSSSPAPAFGRAGHVAVRLSNGAVLIAGGLGETSAELFDRYHNRWANAGTLATVRSGASATLLKNGQVLVAGGFGSKSEAWASAELFDPLGASGVGSRSSHSAPAPIAGAALLFGIPTALLAISLWLRRERLAREAWID
jgi:hypothetical protein